MGLTSSLAFGAGQQRTDLDPGALELLKRASDVLASTRVFSYRVLVSRDRLATNNQIVTYFNLDTVTVARPDKLRIDIDGEHHDVQLLYNGKEATLFTPEEKLYWTHPAPDSIDSLLESIDKRGISLPMSNLLNSSPYDSLVRGLKTAYVVGRVSIADKTFLHLVFTGTEADWQLWIEPGEKPLPRAAIIVYKNVPGSPRITLDFRDWDLDPHPAPDLFNFNKPADARQIQLLSQSEEHK